MGNVLDEIREYLDYRETCELQNYLLAVTKVRCFEKGVCPVCKSKRVSFWYPSPGDKYWFCEDCDAGEWALPGMGPLITP